MSVASYWRAVAVRLSMLSPQRDRRRRRFRKCTENVTLSESIPLERSGAAYSLFGSDRALRTLGDRVPSPDALLIELSTIAIDWRWLAMAWHLAFAGLFCALCTGWRPRAPGVGYVLVAPLLSVSLVAWLSGNPFNGTMFALLAAALLWSLASFSHSSMTFMPSAWLAAGGAVAVFGWTYPHFTRAESWMTYLYASPFGILPCPTLSVVIGVTLMGRHLMAVWWQAVLIAAGLLYGAIGVFRLGVVLDWGLLLAALALAAALACDLARPEHARIRLPNAL
jgi:hypothetical protein